MTGIPGRIGGLSPEKRALLARVFGKRLLPTARHIVTDGWSVP